MQPGKAYLLPGDGFFRTLNFSGGRSSGFMLNNMLHANGGEIPRDRAVVIFCNTGKEREETLEFVRQCGERWNVEIVWLEYRYRPDADTDNGQFKHDYEIVNFETASRNGEPFRQLIEGSSILPNPVMRKCTSELKVRTTERYVRRGLGIAPQSIRNVIGFRYDEPQRWRKRMMEGCTSDFPMVWAKVSKQDVHNFWKANNFDLGIDSELGNCDLCFLKGKRAVIQQIRFEPSRADWWIEQETEVLKYHGAGSLYKSEMAQFLKDQSYTEMKLIATSNAEMDFGDEDLPVMDCFCGD